MHCITCGHFVQGHYKFCPVCGERSTEPGVQPNVQSIQLAQPVPPAETFENEVPLNEVPLPDCPPNQLGATGPQAFPSPYESHEYFWTSPFADPPAQQERLFFGKGAMLFCLIVIGLLSAACAMLIGLYVW